MSQRGSVFAIDGKIFELREQRGWTQEQLASKACLSKRTIERAEAGNGLQKFSLECIAEALDLQYQDLHASPTLFCGTLLADPGPLIGRDGERADFVSWFRQLRSDDQTSRLNLKIIRGWPGVGKTAFLADLLLLRETAHLFPDGILTVSLGIEPNLQASVEGWAKDLGFPELISQCDLETAVGRLRGQLRSKTILFAIDDVWDQDHLRSLQIWSRNCAIVATTRLPKVAEDLSDLGEEFELKLLSDEDSLELLRRHAPKVVEKHPNQSLQLVQDLEGLTLAIEVAGRYLTVKTNRGYTIELFLKELREDTSKLLQMNAPPSRLKELMEYTSPTVAALLRKSTDNLDPYSRACFAAFGSYMPPKPATFILSDVARVWSTPTPEAQETLDRLIDHGLFQVDQELFAGTQHAHYRYYIHDLLVQHARLLLDEGEARCLLEE